MSNDNVRKRHDKVYDENRDSVRARNGAGRVVATAEVESRAAVGRERHAAGGGSNSYAEYLKSQTS